MNQNNIYLKHVFFKKYYLLLCFFYEGLVKKRIYSSCIVLHLRNKCFFSIFLLLSKFLISCCEYSFYIFSIVILKWILLLVCQHFISSAYSLVRSSILSEFKTVSFKRIFFSSGKEKLSLFSLSWCWWNGCALYLMLCGIHRIPYISKPEKGISLIWWRVAPRRNIRSTYITCSLFLQKVQDRITDTGSFIQWKT